MWMSYLKISLCCIKYLYFIIVAHRIRNVKMIAENKKEEEEEEEFILNFNI